MAWWMWIVGGVALLVLEVVISTDFYLVFLGLAGLVVGTAVLAGLSVPVWGEWLLYAGVAVLATVIYRSFWRKRLLTTDREPPPELVGELGAAHAAISAGGRGKIELRGAVWDALNDGATEIAAGSSCRVYSVDGLTLIVRPDR